MGYDSTQHTQQWSQRQREGVNDVMGRPLSAEREGESLFSMDSGNFLDGRRTVTSRRPAAAWEKRLYLKYNTNINVHMDTKTRSIHAVVHACSTPSINAKSHSSRALLLIAFLRAMHKSVFLYAGGLLRTSSHRVHK